MLNKNKEIVVGYWSTKSLGAPLRQMVLYAGYPLKAVFYKTGPVQNNEGAAFGGSHWHLETKPILRNDHPLINLPYVEVSLDNEDTEEKGVTVTQSVACMTFLGRMFNMLGATAIENSYCEQLLCQISDAQNKMFTFVYGQHQDQRMAAKQLYQSNFGEEAKLDYTIEGSLKKIERWLESNQTSPKNPYLVGKNATAPDFSLFEILDEYAELIKYFDLIPCDGMEPDEILAAGGHRHLAYHYGHFRNSEKMGKYLNSQLHKLPFNNKSASFGSAAGGNQWNKEIDVDNTPDFIQIN